MIGAVFGWGVNELFPSFHIQPGSYALVGMGAFLAAATHAPMTAIFLLFELTSNYQVIIPIMFASVLGVMVARALCPDSLDSMELSRQGIYLHKRTEANILDTIFVETVMSNDFEKLRETMSFAEFMEFFPRSRAQYYPIMDSEDNLSGIVSFQDIREIMLEDGLEHVVVMGELAEKNLIKLSPRDTLTTAIKRFGVKDIEAIPVVDPTDSKKLLGVLKRKDVMDAYNKAVLMQDIELNH
jgi:CIC family chloride channel protein